MISCGPKPQPSSLSPKPGAGEGEGPCISTLVQVTHDVTRLAEDGGLILRVVKTVSLGLRLYWFTLRGFRGLRILLWSRG